jgi:hypothetical protein
MRTYHLQEWIEMVRQLAIRIMANIENGTIKLD